jgi:hypothetical protein
LVRGMAMNESQKFFLPLAGFALAGLLSGLLDKVYDKLPFLKGWGSFLFLGAMFGLAIALCFWIFFRLRSIWKTLTFIAASAAVCFFSFFAAGFILRYHPRRELASGSGGPLGYGARILYWRLCGSVYHSCDSFILGAVQTQRGTSVHQGCLLVILGRPARHNRPSGRQPLACLSVANRHVFGTRAYAVV